MCDRLVDFLHDRSGSTAVEYALAVAGIALVIIAAVKFIGTNLGDTFDTLAAALN